MKRIMIAVLGLLMLLPLVACGGKDAGWKDFTAGGATLEVGGKCADALKTLSSSCTKTTPSATCWKKTGEDVVYEYQSLGIRLKTYREKAGDSNEILRGIELRSDSAKTPEGITIGSTADAVRAAYGEPSTDSGSTTGVVSWNTSNTASEASEYADIRGGTISACGHSRRACRPPIAVRTP